GPLHRGAGFAIHREVVSKLCGVRRHGMRAAQILGAASPNQGGNMPHAPRRPPAGPRRLRRLPWQIAVGALLLGLALAAAAIIFPGTFQGTLAPHSSHGIESPGREVEVSLLFDGEGAVV